MGLEVQTMTESLKEILDKIYGCDFCGSIVAPKWAIGVGAMVYKNPIYYFYAFNGIVKICHKCKKRNNLLGYDVKKLKTRICVRGSCLFCGADIQNGELYHIKYGPYDQPYGCTCPVCREKYGAELKLDFDGPMSW